MLILLPPALCSNDPEILRLLYHDIITQTHQKQKQPLRDILHHRSNPIGVSHLNSGYIYASRQQQTSSNSLANPNDANHDSPAFYRNQVIWTVETAAAARYHYSIVVTLRYLGGNTSHRNRNTSNTALLPLAARLLPVSARRCRPRQL